MRDLFFFFQAEDGIRDVAVTGVQTCALPILWCSAARDSLQKRARVMRRPSHSPLTSNMRTGTLPFCATCISAITPARWSITRRTAGSFRTTQTSSSGLLIFATAQRNRRSHEKNYHSLDFSWSPWLSACGCTRAASSAAKDESSTGTGRKITGKDARAKEGGRKEGGGEDTDRGGAAKDGR